MSTAIKPNFFANVPALNTVKTKGAGATDEEKALYTMSVSGGWKVFKGLAEDAKSQLNEVNRSAISQGLPLEEIGRNAIVVSLAQDAIERLLNRVSDAAEACERAD